MTRVPNSARVYTFATVCRLLNIDEATLYRWGESRFLIPLGRAGGVLQYSGVSIDATLSARTFNFSQPPTAYDLWSGSLTLLNPSQAIAELQLRTSPYGTLRQYVSSGMIAAVFLNTTWRYSQQSLALCRVKLSDGIEAHVASHILGVSVPELRGLCLQGVLTSAPKVPRRRSSTYTRASVIELLRKLLPEWIEPEDWIRDRQSTHLPLVGLSKIKQDLAVSTHAVGELRGKRKLHYIWTPGRRRIQYCPLSVAACAAAQR